MIAAQDDAAALAAITSVGTAVRVILHVAQVHRPASALARAAHDFDVVYKIALHIIIFARTTGLKDFFYVLFSQKDSPLVL